MATALNSGLTPIWPLSVHQYHSLIDQGILGPDDPVELLDGIIVKKGSKNPPHRIATRATRQALERVIPTGWYVDEQEPITLHASEPEPDVAVIRGDSRDYRDRHPGPKDVALVVEVADSTLDRDRLLKKRIYAEAGIPHYWVIDLCRRRVEAFSRPASVTFAFAEIYESGQALTLMIEGLPAGEIRVADLLP